MEHVQAESLALSWAMAQIGAQCQHQLLKREASLRYYYRITRGNESWILMDASAEIESARAFLAVGRKLRALGLRVPSNLASELDQGWLLLEDFGQQRLLEVLQTQPQSAGSWYSRASAELLKLQAVKRQDADLPVMDKAWAKRESMRVVTDFLPALSGPLGMTSSDLSAQSLFLESLIDPLAEAVTAQPFCLSHRDFHAANLMCLPTGEVGVLDFQSAFYAPMTYDIASLLRDCYIDWPNQQVEQWLRDFFQQARLLQSHFTDFSAFQQAFDEISLQRHLKCLGLFVHLGRSGQPQYLDALPRTMRYVQYVCEKEPRWQNLLPLIEAGQEVFK